MFYCDPWNPVPFQSRPGLLNDPNASPQQWDNYGCFDQVSVPPVYTAGSPGREVLLVRKMRGGAGSGGSGFIEIAIRDSFTSLFGERLGLFMWREWSHQEFCWNRGGVGHGGGMSKGYAIWEQFPNPLFWASTEEMEQAGVDPEDAGEVEEFMTDRLLNPRRFPIMYLGANIPHYNNLWDADHDEVAPSPYTISAWQNSRIPYDPDFDPRDGNPFNDTGYKVWAIECIDIGPNPWGRYQAPNMMKQMALPPLRWFMSGSLIVTPGWS